MLCTGARMFSDGTPSPPSTILPPRNCESCVSVRAARRAGNAWMKVSLGVALLVTNAGKISSPSKTVNPACGRSVLGALLSGCFKVTAAGPVLTKAA